MPGAGGIVLANYLYNVVAPDGLTLAMPGRSGFLLSNVVPMKTIPAAPTSPTCGTAPTPPPGSSTSPSPR